MLTPRDCVGNGMNLFISPKIEVTINPNVNSANCTIIA